MIKFFSYSGSKIKYIKLINSKINNMSKNHHFDTYIEPFIGSGSILFNLDKEFKRYIINDSDRNIIRIYNSFKKITYSSYIDKLVFIKNEFGSIDSDKEAFYLFRNWFNKNIWLDDSVDEGIFLQILANSVINSFLRFGPNGMNQSFGKRLYIMSEFDFNNIKYILNKTEIHNTDYSNLMQLDGLFYLDPPYMSQNSSYSGFDETDLKKFISIIKPKAYLYTDILNDINGVIHNKELIRNMVSTAPSSNKSKTGNLEYLFSSCNLKIDDNW